MRWDEWLRDRIAGQDGMPDNIKLADEMFAMIRVAETAGVDLPNMSKFLQEHMRSGHKKRNGPRSLEPEEIVLRAKCIASVLELLESGVDVEDARTDVAETAQLDRDKIVRWHQDYEPSHKTGARHIMNISDQVSVFRHEIRREHNRIGIREAIIGLLGESA